MSNSNRRWVPLKALEHYVCELPGIDAPPGYRLETIEERDKRVLAATPFEYTVQGFMQEMGTHYGYEMGPYMKILLDRLEAFRLPITYEQLHHLRSIGIDGKVTLTVRVGRK